MSLFSLSKVDNYRNKNSKATTDVIDIKFPTELNTKELLIYIIEDDPTFMQLLDSYFSKLSLAIGDENFSFNVKNFATGRSCIKALEHNPDFILLNYEINYGLKNMLSGQEIFNKIHKINPNQKIVILNTIDVSLRGAFVVNGLRDKILNDCNELESLNETIIELFES